MKSFKKVFIILLIGIIVYSSSFLVFAEGQIPEGDQEDQWEQVTNTSDLVEAFRYYCKSRDLTIDGSIAGMVTAVTTDVFNGLCANLGINMTQLQAEIKKSTDVSKPLQYLFTQTGITTYNRLFAQFLQDNELDVGDTVEDKELFNGDYANVGNGNGCLVFYIDNLNPGSSGSTFSQHGVSKTYIKQYGSYLLSSSTLFSDIPLHDYKNYSFSINGVTYTGNKNSLTKIGNGLGIAHDQNNNYFGGTEYLTSGDVYWGFSTLDGDVFGGISVFKFANGKVGIGAIGINAGWANVNSTTFNIRCTILDNSSYPAIQSGNVYFYSPTTINNNTYEGDTVINNNGDTNNYYPPEPPKPDGGTPPDDWDIQLPNLDHDWFISGLEKKFPFDIPFNILFALSLLNAEPQTPHFEGYIDLKLVTWHYDFDFSPFENIARYFREFQFFAFILGLMIMTKQLIWG